MVGMEGRRKGGGNGRKEEGRCGRGIGWTDDAFLLPRLSWCPLCSHHSPPLTEHCKCHFRNCPDTPGCFHILFGQRTQDRAEDQELQFGKRKKKKSQKSKIDLILSKAAPALPSASEVGLKSSRPLQVPYPEINERLRKGEVRAPSCY